MDAVEFIKERNRMCKSFYDSEYGSCGDCPAKWEECDEMRVMIDDEPDTIVKIVEKWSAAHPRKTRQSVFLEQWPNAIVENGALEVCPKAVVGREAWKKNGCYGTMCVDCYREFWSQEVE